MTVKKSYSIGDAVWIYGISANNNKLVEGKVIKKLDLSKEGYMADSHYIVEIPSHIEPLLEIRTWETMSQDSKGPVGAFRKIGDLAASIKKSNQVGFAYDEDYDQYDFGDLLKDLEDEVHPDQIHAALEKSQRDSEHLPLDLKQQLQAKPKRRFYKKKKQ